MSLFFKNLFVALILFSNPFMGMSAANEKPPGDSDFAGEVSVLISHFNDASCYKEIFAVLSKTKGVLYAEEISAVKNGEGKIRILYDNTAIDEYRIKFILHNVCPSNNNTSTTKINFNKNKPVVVPNDISRQMNKKENSDANSYSLPNIFSAFSGLF